MSSGVRHESMDISDAAVIRVSLRRTAFVVDDNAQVRNYIQSILRDEGYSVFAFESAIEALNELADRNGDVAVIISDVEMPGLDGIAFAEEVNRRFCGVPVVLMSGAAQRKDSAQSRWPFLAKPFMHPALIEAAQLAVMSVPAISK
jgi:two-component system cell cycle sensor histidine kinase/response regulator CckA